MGENISLLIGGTAGQGVQTIGNLLARICSAGGFFTHGYDSYQSRIRGGHNFHLLRVGERAIDALCPVPDIVVAMDENTMDIHGKTLSSEGIAILNGTGENKENFYFVPLARLAAEAGDPVCMNTVAAGVVSAVLGADLVLGSRVVEAVFGPRGNETVSLNKEALRRGFLAGKDLGADFSLAFSSGAHARPLVSGAKAAALGALAADCRFFPFYPMSPGTPVLTQLANYVHDFPIVLEQAEDELAAVNMAIGASFAGVRSLVSTSGGGFSLMGEGLGFSGMSETPVVIINAQRPGPATGLATRTAQSDLLFAIHASQDEFPRFVFAPGSVEEVYGTVKRAVFLSEKYQVPAIVLMDQYLMDSTQTLSREFVLGEEHQEFWETELSRSETYQRYKFTPSGISPRIRPCTSGALVRSVGNEHTPGGIPSEDPENRNRMMEKRLGKMEDMVRQMDLPDLIFEDSDFFLTGWGSSRGAILEACLLLRERGMAVGGILFKDLWPLDSRELTPVLAGKQMVMVEGNATSQLGQLLSCLTGMEYAFSINKYDGRPIFPGYIVENFIQWMEKK